MSNFFNRRFDHKIVDIVLRTIEVLLILFLGWLGYASFNFGVILGFNRVYFTTTSYVGILIQELIPVAKPIFLFLLPAFFVALRVIFQRIQWKKLALLAIGLGIIFTAPSYLYNLMRWQPLLQTVQGLSVLEVTYHRHSGTFPDGLPGMWINFVIPDELFEEVNQTIETRLAKNNVKLLRYSLEEKSPLTAKFDVHKKTPGGRLLSPNFYDLTKEVGRIEATLYVSRAFQGYDY